MAHIVCLGEALIDFVADVHGVSIQDCPGFRKAAGGAPANVAAGVARLGGSAAFVGKVGDDPFGRYLERTLAACGVDTRPMRFDPDARTGLAFVSLMEDGERDFVFYRHPSADMRLRPDELPSDLFDGARIFHFGSITLISEPSRSATLSALRRARSAGCRISFDPNLRPPLWPSLDQAREQILATIPLVDLVKVSEEEAAFLVGACPETGGATGAARRILEMGPSLVCVTEGAGGSSFTYGGEVGVAPGFPVQAVDTTGAGDGFVAGLLLRLAELPQGWWLDTSDIHRALIFANAVGALTCTQKGAIPALPDLPAVERLLREGRSG